MSDPTSKFAQLRNEALGKLEESGQTYPDPWIFGDPKEDPEADGKVITGQIVAGREGIKTEHGQRAVLEIATEEGVIYSVWLSHKLQATAVLEETPKKGDLISIAQGELIEGSQYEYYTYAVSTAPDPDFDGPRDLALPGWQEVYDRRVRPQEGQFGEVDQTQLPFSDEMGDPKVPASERGGDGNPAPVGYEGEKLHRGPE